MLVESVDSAKCFNDTGLIESWTASNRSAFPLIILMLSIINMLTNGLSLVIFIAEKQRREPMVRMLLILLSVNEVLVNYGLSSLYFVRILLFHLEVTLASFSTARNVIYFVTFNWFVTNIFLYGRNWCCVLIALSRSEAVLRPMSRINRCQIFTRRRLIMLYCVVVTICSVFEILDVMQNTYHFCPAEGWRLFHVGSNMGNPIAQQVYDILMCIQFIFQTAIPICVVSLCTLLMTRALRFNRRNSSAGASLRATRMVQILLLVFISTELPLWLFFFLRVFGIAQDSIMGFAPPSWHVNLWGIGVIFICLDSMFNFVIYIRTSVTFRHTINRLFCRSSVRNQRRRRGDGIIFLNTFNSINIPTPASINSSAWRSFD